jgi:hypothetical protein
MWQNVFLYSVVEFVLYVVECVPARASSQQLATHSVVECALYRMCSLPNTAAM